MKTVIPMYTTNRAGSRVQVRQGAKFVSAPDQHRHHVVVVFGDAMHVEEVRTFDGSTIESSTPSNTRRKVSGDATYGIKPAEGL